MSEGAVVVGGALVELVVRPAKENVVPSMTMDVVLADTIFPPAKLPPANLAPAPDPAGRLTGTEPLELRRKVPPPPKRPPRWAVQLPDDEGWVMVTDRAVMVAPDEVPTTVTH